MNPYFAELESGVKDDWLTSYVAVTEASCRRNGIALPQQEVVIASLSPTREPLFHPVALAVSEYERNTSQSFRLAGMGGRQSRR